MRRFTWLMLLLLMSCQQAVQPPTIRYGEDACANCRMLINEAPYACAIETEAGEVRKYDDFNCMFLDSERVKPMRYWVHHHDKPDSGWMGRRRSMCVPMHSRPRWQSHPRRRHPRRGGPQGEAAQRQGLSLRSHSPTVPIPQIGA
jgi:hypothetical protein